MNGEKAMGGAGRFDGLARQYDRYRPALPEYPVRVIGRYLGGELGMVVDLGCGTGLSALEWCKYSRQVIGIEPNPGMLACARRRAVPNLSFRQAAAQDTGLPDAGADAAVCCQAFHWMKPEPTLREIHRILRRGGVFAAIDYDWPPVSDWRVEQAYGEVSRLAGSIEARYGGAPARWDKAGHLQRIRASGLFRYTREIVFEHTLSCTVERLYGMALSQSGIAHARQLAPQEMEPRLRAYRQSMEAAFGQREFAVSFCYRMRVAVK